MIRGHTAARPPAKRSPLDDFHRRHGGRMIDVAGWSMPLHYRDGSLREHLANHTGHSHDHDQCEC